MCLLKWFVSNLLMISELLGCAGNRFIEFMCSLLSADCANAVFFRLLFQVSLYRHMIVSDSL